jgi:uncharacterized protein YbjT (DUF2867 family)
MQLNIKREILVFGATGGTGIAIIREALARGYGITAFVRDIQHAQHAFNGLCTNLSFYEGDALNAEDVKKAIAPGLDAVVSALGIYQRMPGHDTLTQATNNILAAMKVSGPRRVVCISSLGVGDSRNQGDFPTRIIQKTALRFTLSDKETQEAAIRNSELDWTVIRPSRLLNEGGPAHYLTWTGDQPDKELVWSINRAQVASLAMDSLEDDGSIHKALNITGTQFAETNETPTTSL